MTIPRQPSVSSPPQATTRQFYAQSSRFSSATFDSNHTFSNISSSPPLPESIEMDSTSIALSQHQLTSQRTLRNSMYSHITHQDLETRSINSIESILPPYKASDPMSNPPEYPASERRKCRVRRWMGLIFLSGVVIFAIIGIVVLIGLNTSVMIDVSKPKTSNNETAVTYVRAHSKMSVNLQPGSLKVMGQDIYGVNGSQIYKVSLTEKSSELVYELENGDNVVLEDGFAYWSLQDQIWGASLSDISMFSSPRHIVHGSPGCVSKSELGIAFCVDNSVIVRSDREDPGLEPELTYFDHYERVIKAYILDDFLYSSTAASVLKWNLTGELVFNTSLPTYDMVIGDYIFAGVLINATNAGITLLNKDTGAQTGRHLTGDLGLVTKIALHPTGNKIFAATDAETTIVEWDIASGNITRIYVDTLRPFPGSNSSNKYGVWDVLIVNDRMFTYDSKRASLSEWPIGDLQDSDKWCSAMMVNEGWQFFSC